MTMSEHEQAFGRAARRAMPELADGECSVCAGPVEGFALKCAECSQRARAEWARDRLQVTQSEWKAQEQWMLGEDIERARGTIVEAMRWAKLDAPELPKRVRRREAIEEARCSLSSRLIVLSGPAGSGKTSLATAILQHHIDAGINEPHRYTPAAKLARGARFIECKDLARARSNHRLGHGEAPEVTEASTAPLVVLDDLGVDDGRDKIISDVIYARHGKPKLWTIITTGFRSAQILRTYGDGVKRRILERATTIAAGMFPWECSRCQTSNDHEVAACKQCGLARKAGQ